MAHQTGDSNQRPRRGGPRAAAAAMLLAAVSAMDAAAQEMAIEPRFAFAGHFHEGLAPAMEGGLWGFIDRTGAWVVPPRYEAVLSGSGGRFGVKLDGKWGFVNSGGTMVIQPAYEDAQAFSDGVAAVRKDGLWGYIGPTGREEIAFRFVEANAREDGFLTVHWTTDDGTWRSWKIIDVRGSLTSIYGPESWEATSATGLSDGFGIGTDRGGKYAFDKYGQKAFGYYRELRRFSEGLAAVSTDGKRWRFIDRDGRFAVPGRFDGAREFSQGVAPVQVGGKWGYVDRAGTMVQKAVYDAAFPFREGLALVRKGDRRGFVQLVDGRIREWLAPEFEDAYAFSEGLAPVKRGGTWGYISSGRQGATVRDIVDLSPAN